MECKPNYYAILPANVRYDGRLGASEKLMFAELTALAQKDGYAFAGNRYFAELYGVDARTVRRWISHLETLGYLYVDLVRNSKGAIDFRRVVPLSQPPDIERGVGTKMSYPSGQKCPHNNININNTPIVPVEQALGFAQFWELYPKRVAKQAAAKAFGRIKPDEALMRKILDAVQRQKDSPQWREEGGKYIPNPATWLNGRRWEDEEQEARPEHVGIKFFE